MHRKIIGVLHLIVAAMTLLPVLGLTLFFGGIWGLVAWGTQGREAATVAGIGLAGLLVVLVISAAFAGLLSLVAGAGVLLEKKWGDVLATAVSAVHLFYFPFGTALAGYTVYGLWFAEPAPNGAVPQTSP